MPRRHALLAAPVLLLLLAGCVPTPGASPTAGATSTPTPTVTFSPTPAATPTITPTPGPETEPVTVGCSDLISAQALYDYNPNVSLLSSFSPDRDSLAGEALALQGIACRYINQSSGEAIDIGIVHFTPEGYAAKTASVGDSATSTDAFDGYFDVVGGVGIAQSFADPYWFTVSSATFFEAADAGRLISTAVGSLG